MLWEKTEGWSMEARERQRVIGMVDNVIDSKDVLEKSGNKMVFIS